MVNEMKIFFRWLLGDTRKKPTSFRKLIPGTLPRNVWRSWELRLAIVSQSLEAQRHGNFQRVTLSLALGLK